MGANELLLDRRELPVRISLALDGFDGEHRPPSVEFMVSALGPLSDEIAVYPTSRSLLAGGDDSRRWTCACGRCWCTRTRTSPSGAYRSTADRTGDYADAAIYGRGFMDLGAATSPVGATGIARTGTVDAAAAIQQNLTQQVDVGRWRNSTQLGQRDRRLREIIADNLAQLGWNGGKPGAAPTSDACLASDSAVQRFLPRPAAGHIEPRPVGAAQYATGGGNLHAFAVLHGNCILQFLQYVGGVAPRARRGTASIPPGEPPQSPGAVLFRRGLGVLRGDEAPRQAERGGHSRSQRVRSARAGEHGSRHGPWHSQRLFRSHSAAQQQQMRQIEHNLAALDGPRFEL